MSGTQVLLLTAFFITNCNSLYSGHLHKATNATEAARSMQKRVAEAEHEQPKQATMPEECVKSFQDLQTPETQAAAQKCEEAGQYTDKAITALQAVDEKKAIEHVHEAFEKCGKFSKTCAAAVAPRLVQEMRISGVAVSDACKNEYDKIQKDEKVLAQTQECDNKEKLAEKALTALSNGQGDDAIEATTQGLEKCMNISKTCAFQLAPVVVNSIVMRAMAEAAITQVLVAQPVLVVDAEPVVIVENDGTADPPAMQVSQKKPSLLQMAVSIRPAGKSYKKRNSMVREAAVTTESLVQTSQSHHSKHSVSKLLLNLLAQQKSV
jgi:hypothetical protein